VDQAGDARGDLAGAVGHEGAILRVRLGRDVAARAGAEADAAGVAGARPHRHTAVVGRRVAEHVEEQAVDRVALERLGEDGHRVAAVVVAVDAGGVEPVVDGRLAVRAPEEPLGMRVVDRFLRLAQIEAADDAHLARVRLAKRLAEQVTPGRQERARVVERHARRVLRDDTAHVHEVGVGAGRVHRLDERLRVDDGVGLGEVGLEEPDRLGQPPPIGRSRGLRRDHPRDGDCGKQRQRSRACAHARRR
jgi:hypothetical protein